MPQCLRGAPAVCSVPRVPETAQETPHQAKRLGEYFHATLLGTCQVNRRAASHRVEIVSGRRNQTSVKVAMLTFEGKLSKTCLQGVTIIKQSLRMASKKRRPPSFRLKCDPSYQWFTAPQKKDVAPAPPKQARKYCCLVQAPRLVTRKRTKTGPVVSMQFPFLSKVVSRYGFIRELINSQVQT